MGEILVEKGYIMHLNEYCERVNGKPKLHKQIPWKVKGGESFKLMLEAEQQLLAKIQEIRTNPGFKHIVRYHLIEKLQRLQRKLRARNGCKKKTDKTMELLAALGKITPETLAAEKLKRKQAQGVSNDSRTSIYGKDNERG